MTFKCLNKSWFDTLRDQYQQDLETDIVFPLTYIFYYSPRARDLGYEIKHKISVAEFIKSIITFRRKDLDSGDFLGYEDQNVRIYDQPIPEPDVIYIRDGLQSDSDSDASETSPRPKKTEPTK
ncbi:hypothetical protein F5Y04DRAFT_289319 [Hypomontagnella monticulosa]|nr:hypothetical protein F5Y04DRAFT_289319 [Hypomontagnella monticulosa]